MRVILGLAVLLFSSVQDFTGTWTGTFEGKTFLKLTLAESQGAITGSLRHPTHINTSNDGTLLGIGGSFVDEPLGKTEIVGQELRFSTRDEDGEDLHYVLRLSGTDSGELSLAAPPNETAPKPWKVERNKPETPQTTLRRNR